MSWEQALSGAEVTLTAAARRRIGVDGFGIDDEGVVGRPEAVADLLRLGIALSSIDKTDVEAFAALNQGSSGQVKRAEALGKQTLEYLGRAIAEAVDEQLAGVPCVGQGSYGEYTAWAQSRGWELPVGFDPDRAGPCLANDAGLTVLVCPVARVPEPMGAALCALVAVLSDESFRPLCLESLGLHLDMRGMCPPSPKALESARHDPYEDAVAWLQEVDPGGYEELHGVFEGDDDIIIAHAGQYRDVVMAQQSLDERLRAVHGDAKASRRSVDTRLDHIAAYAKRCPQGALRTFVLAACRCLRGEATATILGRLDQEFERVPGEFAMVDLGFEINHADAAYDELNEMAWGGDDDAYVPLRGETKDIRAFLARITLCERLLIALAALLEIEPLSPEQPGAE